MLNFLTWLTLLVKCLVKKVVILLHSFLIILFKEQKWKEHKSKEHWFKYGLCPKKCLSLCRQIRAVFPIGILPKIIIVEQGTIALTIQTELGFRHFNISCEINVIRSFPCKSLHWISTSSFQPSSLNWITVSLNYIAVIFRLFTEMLFSCYICLINIRNIVAFAHW